MTTSFEQHHLLVFLLFINSYRVIFYILLFSKVCFEKTLELFFHYTENPRFRNCNMTAMFMVYKIKLDIYYFLYTVLTMQLLLHLIYYTLFLKK